MSHTYTNLLYHIIFSTKYRQPIITSMIKDKLYKYIGGIIKGEGGTLIEIGGMPDHIHIAARLKPNLSLSDLLRKIKANSSKYINEQPNQFESFQWQNGYGAFTVNESQINTLKKYIQNQQQHHKIKTFHDEFNDFLKNKPHWGDAV